MLFHSWEFLFVFLPIVLSVFYISVRYCGRIAPFILLVSSLFFYGWWKPAYLLLLALSVVLNYFFSSRILYSTERGKKIFLLLGVTWNLTLLGYFKYASFFTESFAALADWSGMEFEIVLPLAISFFTFQQIAYLVDCRKGKVKKCDFLDYCLFVTFFPQLIAGPIVHHSEMMHQLKQRLSAKPKIERLSIGFSVFFIGLFKKAVLADTLQSYADPVFKAAEAGEPVYFMTAWIGALAFGFQIYFDFSGYTDMATGLARLFNIRLPVNFYSPYQAKNIVEFWRRWHITLSRFLKDYLYLPLGGNRKGRFRRYANLMTVMLLGGLWHGAAWTFVFWGGLHGLYLCINHAWKKYNPFHLSDNQGRILTFLAVTVAWVFFRSESFSGASNMLSSMLCLSEGACVGLNGLFIEGGAFSEWMTYFGLMKAQMIWPFLLGCFIIVMLLPSTGDIMRFYRLYYEPLHDDVPRQPKILWHPNLAWGIFLCILGVTSLICIIYQPMQNFLYFQF